jgi:adenylylsulfate kinase-like enzyme
MNCEIGKKNNVTWFNGYVTREKREKVHGHKGAVIWFTGLSASGKSTIAHLVEKELYKRCCSTYVLDGDNVRHGLCSDLSFRPEDRAEMLALLYLLHLSRRTAKIGVWSGHSSAMDNFWRYTLTAR